MEEDPIIDSGKTEHTIDAANALLRIRIQAAGSLKEIHKLAWAIDDNFGIDDALEFLEAHGKGRYDADELLAAEDAYYYGYQRVDNWRPDERKMLDAENERRRSAIEVWRPRARSTADTLSLVGGVVLRCEGWGPEHDDGLWQPFYWLVSLPNDLQGELESLLTAIGGEDVEWTVEHYKPDEVVLEFIQEFATFETLGPAPREEETVVEFAERIAIDETHFRAVLNAFRRSGGNAALFAALMRSHSGRNETVKFVVDGLLPRQAVALLIGPPKIGKSTLALQGAVDVADGASFLGLATQQASGDALVVFLSGEDPQSVVETRLRALSGDAQNGRLLPICDQSSMLKALDIVETVPVDLLVVDTAAAFVGASVNDAGPTREFMAALADFAKQKNCAVLVIHHTNKGVSPRSSKATAEGMKGSSEFTSAARVVLTMHPAGERRLLDVYQHNMPSSVPMLKGPLRLIYDPTTERHELDSQAETPEVGEGQPKAEAERARRDAESVAAVIFRARETGRMVALSGKNEPFNFCAPALAGWARARVRTAHRNALSAGLIKDAAAPVDAAE